MGLIELQKRCQGLTLIEILLFIVMVSLLISLFLPQWLRDTREQSVDKTASEMNQIVLAARNYYQDKQQSAVSGTPNSSYWPQNLQALVSEGYLPQSALCSQRPLVSNLTATCPNKQAYVLFPSTNNGQYDTTVPGIAVYNSNKGGSFWGVSLTLPNAKIAEQVREKLPFGTRCDPNTLKTGAICTVSDADTTVTAIVPRPAIFMKAQYKIDGLIQSMGDIKVCDNNDPAYGQRYPPNGNSTTKPSCDSNTASGGNGHNVVHIPMPPTCSNAGMKPVLFVYPFNIDWKRTNSVIGTWQGNRYYPGISLFTTRDDTNQQWIVTATESTTDGVSWAGTVNFNGIYLAYFTVCAPSDDPNKWDPSWFQGT